jgi:glycerol-3-phosphate dehydrogenase subunit C
MRRRGDSENANGSENWRFLFTSGQSQPQLPTKVIVSGLLQDEGYFASLDGVERIKVANHTYDLGEYLRILDRKGELDRGLGPLAGRMAYFAPCHLKEQDIGSPWLDLFGLVPNLSLEKVGGAFDCCGIAGIMGFKREFHGVSLEMGRRLMDKIRAVSPDKIVTDCLSCRIQFNQSLPQPVSHPIELLREAYRNSACRDRK